MTTIVSASNQVNIPPEIAREYDIHPGSKLEWTKTGAGEILIKLLPSRGELARQLMGAGRRWLKPGADPIAELIHARDQDDKLDAADERK